MDEAEARESTELGLAGPEGGEASAPSADDIRRFRPGETDPDPETKPARPGVYFSSFLFPFFSLFYFLFSVFIMFVHMFAQSTDGANLQMPWTWTRTKRKC